MSLGGWAGLTARATTIAGAVWSVKDIPAEMGAAPSGERAERVRRSPQFRDGRFRNSVPGSTVADGGKILREAMRRDARRRPARPIPVQPLATAGPVDGLQVTWLGHASTLVEIEGRRVLIDPVWSDRCSPSQLVGPKRLHGMPLALADLPPIDAVVISHDHYDHLDMATTKALAKAHAAPFLVPLGVGEHLRRWGVPAERILELDWDERATVAGIRFVLTAARHFSGRGLRRDATLWGSWVIAGERRKVFYTGDTGYFDGFARVGAEHGPFDAALVQVGAYGEAWPDVHLTPEDGVQVHVDVRGGLLIPVHWCTFVLAFHPWSEPVERVCREAKERDVPLAVPRPGQPVDVDNPPEVDPWWGPVAETSASA